MKEESQAWLDQGSGDQVVDLPKVPRRREALLIKYTQHRTLPGKPGHTVSWSWITDWLPSKAAAWLPLWTL